MFFVMAIVLRGGFSGNISFADDSDDLLLLIPSVLNAKPSEPDPKPVPEPEPEPDPAPAPGGPNELSMVRKGDRLIVTSNKAPTWKVTFAIGSGAPGGGTAIAVHVPADDSRSLVEPRPYLNALSGAGLDNIEWRWRPWGGSQGTRGSAAHTSNITEFEIIENTPKRIEFHLEGDWKGISHFNRTTIVTPDGFTTSVRPRYADTPGQDSMWWVMALFHPDKMDGDHVMVSDNDTPPVRLPYSHGAYRPLPPNITLPYNLHFPLTTSSNTIRLKMRHFAETRGNPHGYEFFDQGTHAGNYYLVYPRWIGSFRNVTYHFEWNWRFTP